MTIESILRKLARSHYWQSLYNSSKSLNGVKLFENDSNFSGLQVQFLNWLRIYDMLYDELHKFESPYLTEKVIEDNDRCDAYLYYRRKNIERDWKKHREEERLQKLRDRHPKKREGNANLIDVQLTGNKDAR